MYVNILADKKVSAPIHCHRLTLRVYYFARSYKRVGVGEKPDNSVPDNSRTRQQTDTAGVA